MRRRRFKKIKANSKKNKLIYIGVMILLSTWMIVNYIGSRLTPIVQEIIELNVNKSVHNYLFTMFNSETLTKDELMDIVQINKNKEDEILSIDYRFDLVYKNLSAKVNEMFQGVRDLNIKMEYYDYDKELFFVPLGIIDKDNIFITDFGFKLPVKVVFFTDINMKYKTKVTNYGMNNVLVELYLVVDVWNTVLSPSTFYKFDNSYEMVIASKVIMGKIPVFYGDGIEKSSSIVSS